MYAFLCMGSQPLGNCLGEYVNISRVMFIHFICSQCLKHYMYVHCLHTARHCNIFCIPVSLDNLARTDDFKNFQVWRLGRQFNQPFWHHEAMVLVSKYFKLWTLIYSEIYLQLLKHRWLQKFSSLAAVQWIFLWGTDFQILSNIWYIGFSNTTSTLWYRFGLSGYTVKDHFFAATPNSGI